MLVGFESLSWSHPHYFTLLVTQSLIGFWDRNLGGGRYMNSRLADVVSSGGLAHSYNSCSTCYKETGLFTVYAIVPPSTIEQFCYELFEEFRLMGRSLTEESLTRAKNKVKVSFLMALDGTFTIAEDIGRQLLTIGRRISPAELFSRIDSIEISDVLEFIDRHFNDTCPAIVAIGPVEKLPSYNTFREWTDWNGRG